VEFRWGEDRAVEAVASALGTSCGSGAGVIWIRSPRRWGVVRNAGLDALRFRGGLPAPEEFEPVRKAAVVRRKNFGVFARMGCA